MIKAIQKKLKDALEGFGSGDVSQQLKDSLSWIYKTRD